MGLAASFEAIVASEIQSENQQRTDQADVEDDVERQNFYVAHVVPDQSTQADQDFIYGCIQKHL